METDEKYVCCNADEGDPGAFMDRSVLEGDPHVVLEAMAIAGYAIGAQPGYIYVRAEYPVAVARLETAINQARQKGLLGQNIFGSDFSFDIGLRLGAGAVSAARKRLCLPPLRATGANPVPQTSFPCQTRAVWQAYHFEQRRDLCQRSRHYFEGRKVVFLHWNGKIPRY